MTTMTHRERIEAAIRCEKPDRVPISPMLDFFCARYKGVMLDEFINDNDLGRDLLIQIFDEFGGWDATYQSTTLNEFAFGLTLPMRMKVPGRELPRDMIWQFIEIPIIEVEDYDFAIANGFLPLWGKLFPKMRPHQSPAQIPGLMEAWNNQAIKDTQIWESRGVQSFTGVAISPPFDFFSMGRSLKEFSVDLHRRPEKVLAAMDAITPGLIEVAIGGQTMISQATRWGYMTNFIGATRGSATFISPKMFEKFNWPYIKRIALALIDAGITPLFHFDSDWTPMLEFFKDLPKGKCVLELDSVTDIFKAKQVLAGHMCLMGDVPAALLTLGTPDQVTAYVKRLCEEVGDGGGYILSSGCSVPVDTKPANLGAMIEAGNKYGIYN
jgi:uroporphyrinogen-III decarboxylase